MALKVFDLQCEHGHVFEGWFASAEAFAQQREAGLLTCPICNSHRISKQLSAPRLNMGRGKAPQQEIEKSSDKTVENMGQSDYHNSRSGHPSAQTALREKQGAAPPIPAHVQAQFLQHMRQMLKRTENVGARFADEARSMHEGEIAHRPIRGTATRAEQAALLRDGISVLPVPDFLDDERMQ